jgi:hypothetical protein
MTSLWPAGLSARMVAFGPGSIRGTPPNGRPWVGTGFPGRQAFAGAQAVGPYGGYPP